MFDPLNEITTLSQLAVHVREQAEKLGAWADAVAHDKGVKPAEIAVQLFHIKAMYEALDGAAKKVYHTKDRLDKNVMPERLADYGMDMIRVPEIARSFSVLDKTSASMVDKAKGFEWLRHNNLGDLIQETVNAGTLASAMRNMVLEQGIEPPEDIIKITSYKATSINKYTPK